MFQNFVRKIKTQDVGKNFFKLKVCVKINKNMNFKFHYSLKFNFSFCDVQRFYFLYFTILEIFLNNYKQKQKYT